ncbi:MAG: YihY/virulence factor BrkB family protein [Bacteroidales bacterium]|jgi:membrane protein
MANPLSWAIRKIKEINDAIWHTPLSELSRRKSILIRQLRIIVLAARGFSNDKVQIRASALTFYSVLSIVPVAAIVFAISKGFGLEQNLTQMLTKNLSTQQEVLQWVLPIAKNALKATNGGYIAGVGVIVLFWSVMSLLNHIESSFNHIWEILVPRAWYRKFTDYLTIMLIAPVLLILSSSVTLFINTKFADFMDKAPILDLFKPVIAFLIKASPYLLVWLILTLLFIVMPNTKVKFKSAFVAGIVSGTILQFLQWFYIDLQFGISKLSMLYGSFAAIPLFIVWLQMSWIVVLLGAELAFANQNVSRYEFEFEALNISHFQKRAITLMIMRMIIKNFVNGEPPVSSEILSVTLKIPVRLVRDIMQDLNNAGLVSTVIRNDSKERHFQPGMDINSLTVSNVISRLDRMGVEQRSVLKNREMDRVNEILTKFEKCMAKSGHNVLIRDI